MKKVNFVKKLVKKEKITIVETSTEVQLSYSIKAENSLKAAKILAKQNLFEESISMSYYAMYHKAISLLRLIGIKCENHDATIIILKELFNLDIKNFSDAKIERIDKQYYVDFTANKKDAEELIQNSEKFIQQLDLFIDSLTQDKRIGFLKDFERTYF